MNYFEKKCGILFLLLTIPLLFLPKINIISFQSETAGLRIDDFILLGIGALLFWAHFQLHKTFYSIEKLILSITLFGILSFLSNRLLVYAGILPLEAKIFYTIRLLEYFVFFYIGALTARYFPSNKIILALFFWNISLMTMQKMGWAGAITVEGYAGDVSIRAQGIASFPSEMGLILNLMFCYFIFEDSPPSKFVKLFPLTVRPLLIQLYPYCLLTLFGTFIVFTGNRISILALLICFAVKLKSTIQWKSISSVAIIICLTPLLIGGALYLVNSSEAVSERSAELFSVNNFNLIELVWEHTDLKSDSIAQTNISSDEYDISWWMRIHKWIYALKVYLFHPECYLQGIGPGTTWSALDGGLLRIFVEYGILGSWLFWQFFSHLAKINSQLKWMTLASMINMIFFDAYLAYKVMSIFFFIGGQAFENKIKSTDLFRNKLGSCIVEKKLQINQTL